MAIKPEALNSSNVILESILARLKVLEEENAQLKVTSNNIKEIKQLKLKLPDPKKFSGEDLSLFP